MHSGALLRHSNLRMLQTYLTLHWDTRQRLQLASIRARDERRRTMKTVPQVDAEQSDSRF